jgi:hypothetical protein
MRGKQDIYKMNLGLITRCKNEPFIVEFVNHYINEGVDQIYIIDDNSIQNLYDKIKNDDRVTIIYDINFSNGPELNILYKKIKGKYDWIICVDADEFITTKKNINNTIKDELNTNFKDVDCIKIPWVMMAFNGIEKNPNCLLEENVYRWNHDKKHISKTKIHKFRCRHHKIEVKCIFKTKSFNSCWLHHPKDPANGIKIVDSIYNKYDKLNPFYENLREKDIGQAFLVCYHYRFVSKQQIYEKTNNNNIFAYKQSNIINIMLQFDYPEIKDNTLKIKSEKRQKWFI